MYNVDSILACLIKVLVVASMPDEDGLPSYEEATGLDRILPPTIAREIRQRVTSQSEEGSTTTTTYSTMCCFTLWSCLVCVLGYGILLVVVGLSNLAECPHSKLPQWLLGSGASVVGVYLLVLFLSLKSLCFPRHRFDTGQPQFLAWFVAMDVLFACVWYCLGCYWTWSSVSSWSARDNSEWIVTGDRVVSQGDTVACVD